MSEWMGRGEKADFYLVEIAQDFSACSTQLKYDPLNGPLDESANRLLLHFFARLNHRTIKRISLQSLKSKFIQQRREAQECTEFEDFK